MSRYYLKVSLAVLLLLSIGMVIIRAQPYQENRALRSLLMPDGCGAPCFLGIRPGVTTVDEALALLEKSGWATNVHTSQGGIVWDWTGKQPDFIRTDMPASLFYGTQNITNLVWIYTDRLFGDILIGLPEPVNTLDGFSFLDRLNATSWNVSYTQDKIFISIAITCDHWNVFYGRSAILIASPIPRPIYFMNWGDLNSRQERYCQ